MRRSGWPYAIAALGVLGAIAAPFGDVALAQAIDAVGSTDYLPAFLTMTAVAPDTVPSTDKPCRQGSDDRNSNMCAQWKAADATADAAGWAGRSFQLGVVGAIIGALTLCAAGVAAFYAMIAARETKRTADISDRTARYQLRAYIGCRRAHIGSVGPDRKVSVIVEVQNFGQTPAYRVSRRIGYETRMSGRLGALKPLDASGDAPAMKVPVINPGQQIELEIDLDFPNPANDVKLLRRGGFIFIYGRIEYQDIFKKRRASDFRFRLQPDGELIESAIDAPAEEPEMA